MKLETAQYINKVRENYLTLFTARNYAEKVMVWIIVSAWSSLSIVHPEVDRN